MYICYFKTMGNGSAFFYNFLLFSFSIFHKFYKCIGFPSKFFQKHFKNILFNVNQFDFRAKNFFI